MTEDVASVRPHGGVIGMPCFTARQASGMLLLLCLLAAWRLLSLDFAGLLSVVETRGHFSPFGDEIVKCFRAWCDAEWKLKAAQVITAVALLAGGWWRLRWLTGIGLLSVALFNMVIAHLVQPMFMLDLSLSMLTITVVFPCRWRTCFSSSDPGIHEPATWLLRSLLAYLLVCYCMAGVSKLDYSWLWFTEVGLGAVYPFAKLVEFAEFPWWLDMPAQALHRLFTAHPWLDAAAAAAGLVLELVAPLALFIRNLRIIIPFMLVVLHVFLWLSCGIVFWEMGLIILALGWICFRNRTQQCLIGARPGRGMLTVMVAISLSLVPGMMMRSFPPFLNHRFFGWSYRTALPKYQKSQYALGFLDPATNSYRPLPNGYGGFRDYTLAVVASWCLRIMVENPDDPGLQNYNSRLLNDQVRSLRPHDSNKSMLGWFAMPDRLTSETPELPLKTLGKSLYLLKGETDPTGTARTCFGMVWTPIGDVKLSRVRVARLYREAPASAPTPGTTKLVPPAVGAP